MEMTNSDATEELAGAHQVLIIGSGYAGSIVAYRLAKRGINSVVLERGRRWPITPAGDTFATPDAPDGRAAWLSTTSPFTPTPLNVYPGVLEAYPAEGVTVLAGAGVGGGSLVNNAVVMQPSRELFERSFQHSLSYDEMDRMWYPRARRLIGPTPIPADVLASSFYTAARSFEEEAAAARFAPLHVDMAIDWDIVRQEMTSQRRPSVVLGQSIWGANSGAKLSVDRTILAAAEGTGRVKIVTLTNVVDIEPSGHNYRVVAQQIDERGQVVATRQYRADIVVFAAGSLNTNRLLVRARDTGRLPNLSAGIGTSWGNNGDNISLRTGMPYNNPAQGGPSGIVVRDWSGNPVGPTTLLNFPFGEPPPEVAAGFLGYALVGSDGLTVSASAPRGAIGTLGCAIVKPLGRFSYDAATGQVGLSWPKDDPAITASTAAVNATLDKLNAANPGTRTDMTDPSITAHPVGGVRLGVDCTPVGMLTGYQSLWVADGSMIPGSCGTVPPLLTVSALADRTASAIMARLGITGDQLEEDVSTASAP
jgi:cholesterol oxidase